jgi:tetratricopeptide (TPR) repeat protein
MWKVFTSSIRIAALLTAVMLAGCAAAPAPRAVPMPEPGTAAAAPAPEVRDRNADAFERALGLLRDERLTEAEALLRQVVADQPELAGPWVNLAQIYLRQQRDDAALDALQRAVQANPANCAARNELGVLLRRRGEFAAAEDHYLACLTHQPDFEPAHLNLGILYELYLGRLPEALAAYRRYQALSAEPDRRVDIWVVDLERRLGS